MSRDLWKKKKIVALFDRETNLLFLVSLMKLHRGMYTLKQFILMSISAIFGRDHSLLIAWGGGRCRNIFFFRGREYRSIFLGEGGIKLFFFGGITWFSGQTESVVADRVLNWGDYKNWMPRYLLSWFVSFQVKLRQAMWLFKLQWHGMMRNGMGCYDMTWYCMVWHGMVQNGIAWHEMRWRDIILLCITWDHLALHGRHGIYDMEFHGMEWHDVARFVKWKLI